MRAAASGAATFMQVLEAEMLQSSTAQMVPLPALPPSQPLMPPQIYPWLPAPVPLYVRDEKDGKKRPPPRGDRRSARR
jgi:hypothetical protein